MNLKTVSSIKKEVEKVIEEYREKIKDIIYSTEEPTFENTVVELDNAYKPINRVFNYVVVHSGIGNISAQEVEDWLLQKITDLQFNVYSNLNLYKKIKKIKIKELRSTEKVSLYNNVLKEFESCGMHFNKKKRNNYKKMLKRINTLGVKFERNNTKNTNKFAVWVKKLKQLDGIPEEFITIFQDEASKRGRPEEWAITFQGSNFENIMEYANNRTLRKKVFEKYVSRGLNNNKEIIKEILNTKLEIAKMFGHKTYAHYELKQEMVNTPTKVSTLINKLWPVFKKKAKEDLRKYSEILGCKQKEVEPWDWRYAARIDRENNEKEIGVQIQEYFELSNVIKGVFFVADKLYGLKFNKTEPTLGDEEYRVYLNNTFLGSICCDYYVKETKGPGAWASNLETKTLKNPGKVLTCFNFTKNDEDVTLLSLENVLTVFHEFGHAIHSLACNSTYEATSSMCTSRDFIELPSQIMEKFALEYRSILHYARHYKTGKKLPKKTLDLIIENNKRNTGFPFLEYLLAAYLDLKLHSRTKKIVDVEKEERKILFLNTIKGFNLQ